MCSLFTVTAINLTMMKGGMQENVVPAEMSLTFDIRLAIDVDHDAFEQQVRDKIAKIPHFSFIYKSAALFNRS